MGSNEDLARRWIRRTGPVGPETEARMGREIHEGVPQMTDYTQEQAERIGREAVAEGWRHTEGTAAYLPRFHRAVRLCGDGVYRVACGVDPVPHDAWPDPRDPLTAKAFELWVEDVARAKWGAGNFDLRFDFDACGRVCVLVDDLDGISLVNAEAPTGPEACIAAVKAMRERE